jgi:hypothetical protein
MASRDTASAPTEPQTKGAPTPDASPVPEREWTDASREEERALLVASLKEAERRGDHHEVRRVRARMRLLDER